MNIGDYVIVEKSIVDVLLPGCLERVSQEEYLTAKVLES